VIYDTDYDDWKVGDTVTWAIDDDPDTMIIESIDATYKRVYWLENGEMDMTRMTNLKRERTK
jgi:hypothetical protein